MRRAFILLAAILAASCQQEPKRYGTDVHFPPSGGGTTVSVSPPLSGTNPITLPAATDSTAGYLSAADKTKLDGLNANPISFFETGTIDFTAISNTTLVPAVAGKHWRTDFFRFRMITNGPGISVVAEVNVGVTPPDYTEILLTQQIGGAFPAGFTFTVPGSGGQFGYATVSVDTTPVIVRIGQAASGDVMSGSFQIWGEYY